MNSNDNTKRKKKKKKVSLKVKSSGVDTAGGGDNESTKIKFVDFLGWEQNYQNWFFGINGSRPYKDLCGQIRNSKGVSLADIFEGSGNSLRAKKSRQKNAALIVEHVMKTYGVDVKTAAGYLSGFSSSLSSRRGNAAHPFVTKYLRAGGASGAIKEYFDDKGYTAIDTDNDGGDDNDSGGNNSSTSSGISSSGNSSSSSSSSSGNSSSVLI
eukprot:g2285.t1